MRLMGSRDPDEGTGGDRVEEWQKVCRGEMNAAVGGGASERRLVGQAVDVDVTGPGIDGTAPIEAGFQAFEPQDAMSDGGFGEAGPGESDRLTRLEGGPYGPALAYFGGHAMQTKRCPVGVLHLSDAKSGCGRDEATAELVSIRGEGMPPGDMDEPGDLLKGNRGQQEMTCREDVKPAAGEPATQERSGHWSTLMRTLDRRPLAS